MTETYKYMFLFEHPRLSLSMICFLDLFAEKTTTVGAICFTEEVLTHACP